MHDIIDIAIRLASALAAGSLLGFERSFHGRPAGIRTHALVCLASALLMLVPAYQATWLGIPPDASSSTNPSRMAQGIMTGIGFLGAGSHLPAGVLHRPRSHHCRLSLVGGGSWHSFRHRILLCRRHRHTCRGWSSRRASLARMAAAAAAVRPANAAFRQGQGAGRRGRATPSFNL